MPPTEFVPSELAKDWQLKCSVIKQRAAQVLASGQWADCSFAVGASRSRLPAHKLVLAMASPVFDAMLYGALAEGKEPIAVPDMEPDMFYAMLEYIYTDNIKIDSCSTAQALYYAAQKYMLPHLHTVCASYLFENVNPESACSNYELAHIVGEKSLKDKCLEIMQTRTLEVLEAGSFLHIQEETMVHLFAMETLHIESELQLFTAAERYLHARATNDLFSCLSNDHMVQKKVVTMIAEQTSDILAEKEKVTETSQQTSEIPVHKATVTGMSGHTLLNRNPALQLLARARDSELMLLEAAKRFTRALADNEGSEAPTAKQMPLRKAVENIRFLTLTPQEFAKHPTLLTLLTNNEIKAIAMNLITEDTPEPIPNNLSTCRKSRTDSRTDATFRSEIKFKNILSGQIFSQTFYVKTLPWRLGVTQCNNHLDVYLYCNWEQNQTQWICDSVLVVKLIPYKTEKEIVRNLNHRFGPGATNNVRFNTVIKWEDLLNPENGYLQDDKITVEVSVKTP